MYKVPSKFKKQIAIELKKFIPLIGNLQAKGKASSEDDARILLNDVLNDVLGYDKYNELKTELREKNGRLDYVVKLSEGSLAKKADKFDCIIEAKAAHVVLNQSHIDQTLSYCLSKGVDFFILTNAVIWQLHKVKFSKNDPSAELVHEVDFGTDNSVESLTDQFYLFSKASYLAGDWLTVSSQVKATSVADVVAVLLSDKIIKSITRELSDIHQIKLNQDQVKEIVENQIIKAEVGEINTKLLKKLNTKEIKPKQAKSSFEIIEGGECNKIIDIPAEENEELKKAA